MMRMGTRVLRRRGGREYVYYVYYDDGQRVEAYCGPPADPETDRKVLRCEKEELTRQQRLIAQRLQAIRKQLG